IACSRICSSMASSATCVAHPVRRSIQPSPHSMTAISTFFMKPSSFRNARSMISLRVDFSRAARSSSASYTSSGRYVEIWRLPATLFCGIRVTSSQRNIVLEFAVAPNAHAGVHAHRCHEPVDLVAPLVDPPGGVYLALHDLQDLGPHRLAL